jgi:hypothetical protein
LYNNKERKGKFFQAPILALVILLVERKINNNERKRNDNIDLECIGEE